MNRCQPFQIQVEKASRAVQLLHDPTSTNAMHGVRQLLPRIALLPLPGAQVVEADDGPLG